MAPPVRSSDPPLGAFSGVFYSNRIPPTNFPHFSQDPFPPSGRFVAHAGDSRLFWVLNGVPTFTTGSSPEITSTKTLGDGTLRLKQVFLFSPADRFKYFPSKMKNV